MINLINKLYQNYFLHYKNIRYLFVGGWNTVFSYIVFLVLYYLLSNNIHYLLILVLSQIIGLTNAFLCYKFLVFRTKGNFLLEYLKFYLVYGVSFLINLFLLFVFVSLFNFDPIISQLLIGILIIIGSYFAHNLFSFKST
jgi:putative flippase GtrA